MSRHHPLPGRTLIAAAAGLAVVGIALLALSSRHPAPIAPAPQVHARAPAAPQPSRPATTVTWPVTSPPAETAGAPAGELPPPGAGPAADPAIQRALDAATAPDLPAATAKALVTLGRQVWTAEATGAGRQRWPGYFGNRGATWTYRDFRIQAAIARRDPSAPARALVRLVWVGTDPTGQVLDDRIATVTFTRQGQTWTPVR